ncbi:haloacid dehalogenase superfamily, subfamily IA, variant 3 with third motif having DD or ED/haloacid dehalogenase superfamily, subfamily IA, variant 1 with third motif having Dx(3-4)D or Dx(3-4)E [Mariniphaga anaerophila]|uniref:Haloacid dehalogenase superfamily, subfamily IA, variant 3 with third motif having DD or ED/haloacid dehalogenase superfamily, subfamily IA, variant 1 with third motif having Dx(3-4)D or Dx(3-4)E n=1 Tax=Mariniphaga anaerophila TaxID=1484053 RepID=A0A1M4VWE6_9BACT|nr:HAD family hydrolase [Mariniphaga anaerophila]SHE73286.1 haloacid dehalogenase superfamily, subfamily IA, variant 3 with third motif having DD or ED/haloacid dehalogenase superfamily, subfamily IA, variant 1 with third motif having Dx(3-4)D or Dx(3-4)E [Mariniphaga anaerophila]
MKYNCVIFDNDGVLIDSEIISNKVMVEMAKDLGVLIDLDYAMEHFSGESLKSIMEYIEKQGRCNLPEDFERHFRQKTYKAFETDLAPVKGVKEILERLTVPFCVASSGPREKIELSLTATRLIGFFSGRIFSSYDIGSWKPDPEIFLYAAREMGFKPHECVVIEDSIAGVKAAKNGGFNVFAFAKENNRREFEKLEATTFFSMEKLAMLLHLNS